MSVAAKADAVSLRQAEARQDRDHWHNQAVAIYMRTSSATNVGADKDSERGSRFARTGGGF
jgi:hypothetical protein